MSSQMSDKEFWQIIARSRRRVSATDADGNMDRQAEDLAKILKKLGPVRTLAFRDRLYEHITRAYRWDLWDAAYLIAHGCSDDGFFDFRGWLISMGREAYENALHDPESLAVSAAAPGVEDFFFEEFASIPDRLYEETTGREAEPYPGSEPEEPTGTKCPDDEFPRRFPKLWQQFGTPH